MSTYNRINRNQQKSPNKGKPNRQEDLEQLAAEMDTIYRRRLPDNVIRCEILGGKESEIRQEALIMAVGGFLHRNPGYIQARKMNNREAIQVAMERCAAITLRYSKARIAFESSQRASHHTQVNENNGGSCQHPSQLKTSEWPLQVKASVVMTSVARAVREGSLSQANADIVAMVYDKGLPVIQVARLRGTSSTAVYQQLRRVRKVIPEVMEWVEVPSHS